MTPPGDLPPDGGLEPPGKGRRRRAPPLPSRRRGGAGPRRGAAALPRFLFSPPALFGALRERAIPVLSEAGWPRIWVAGCGTGEEAWSLAICLREAGLLDRSRIYATDVDDGWLREARRGTILLSRMGPSQANYLASGGEGSLSRYLRVGARTAVLDPTLAERVVFGRHDVETDAPFHLFDLVLWRAPLGAIPERVGEHAVRVLDGCCLPGGWLAFRPGEEPGAEALARYLRPVPGVPLYRKEPA